MADTKQRIAWVEVPTEEEVRARIPAGTRHPYDFGFIAGMARLRSTHPRIAEPLRALYKSLAPRSPARNASSRQTPVFAGLSCPTADAAAPGLAGQSKQRAGRPILRAFA